MSDQTPPQADTSHRPGMFLRALNALDLALGWVERLIVAGSVLFMAGLMSLHVVSSLLSSLLATYSDTPGLTWLSYINAVIPSGIAGTYEITEMLIVVMTFVGVGYAARHARHISMSAIYDQLSGRARKTLLVIIYIGTGLLMFYFGYKSAQYVEVIHQRGRVSASIGMPMWIVYLSLPIGFTLAGVQYLLATVRNLVSPGIWRNFREEEAYADVPIDDTGATHADDVPRGV